MVDRAQRVGPHPHGVVSLFDGRPYASVIVSCMMMDMPLEAGHDSHGYKDSV